MLEIYNRLLVCHSSTFCSAMLGPSYCVPTGSITPHMKRGMNTRVPPCSQPSFPLRNAHTEQTCCLPRCQASEDAQSSCFCLLCRPQRLSTHSSNEHALVPCTIITDSAGHTLSLCSSLIVPALTFPSCVAHEVSKHMYDPRRKQQQD